MKAMVAMLILCLSFSSFAGVKEKKAKKKLAGIIKTDVMGAVNKALGKTVPHEIVWKGEMEKLNDYKIAGKEVKKVFGKAFAKLASDPDYQVEMKKMKKMVFEIHPRLNDKLGKKLGKGCYFYTGMNYSGGTFTLTFDGKHSMDNGSFKSFVDCMGNVW